MNMNETYDKDRNMRHIILLRCEALNSVLSLSYLVFVEIYDDYRIPDKDSVNRFGQFQ